MDRLKKTLPSWSTHNFHKKWDSWNITLLFEEGDKDTLIMHIDFSAVFDIIQKEAITCEIPPHAMQLVIVVSTNPRDVDGKRIWDNESWHFWGEKSDGELESNYYFYYEALSHINEDKRKAAHKNSGGSDASYTSFNYVALSDGCGEQFKQRRIALMISFLCKQFNIRYFKHVWACTANFKCIVDSQGQTTKLCLYRHIRNDNFKDKSMHTAYDVVRVLTNHMPDPRGKGLRDDQREMMTITNRHQRYLIDKRHQDVIDDPEGVIFTDFAVKQWWSSALDGIKSMSSVEASYEDLDSVAKDVPIGTRRTIVACDYACFCLHCRSKYKMDTLSRNNLQLCPNFQTTNPRRR